jgi:hypothetical protein
VTADFDQLVDLSGLGPEEQARLQRVHEMLVAAGPPADLPAALSRPPEDVPAGADESNVIPLAPRRRRAGAALLLAATVAAACFGGGYLLANQTHGGSPRTVRIAELQGQQGQQFSQAALRVGSADGNGNWPVQLTVSGLKPLPNKSRYYLMVWDKGKPVAFCGTFEVGPQGSTTVNFNVAYKITDSTRWVVTEMAPGMKYPGHVVMTTT